MTSRLVNSFRTGRSTATLIAATVALVAFSVRPTIAAGGLLNLSVFDEQSGQPATTRAEIYGARTPDRPMTVRRTIDAGVGMVIDRSVELSLPDGPYQFRMIRGPEYRIITGNFTLEKTSLDDHRVELPRMIDMRAEGWTSGDCLVPASTQSLPLRMVSEDLHLSRVLGRVEARPIPRRDRDDPPVIEPMWISEDASAHGGLAFYGSESAATDNAENPPSLLPSERIAATPVQSRVRIAVEDPFAWPLPVWIASGRIDGYFLLGDWLRLDEKVLRVKGGRPTTGLIKGSEQSVGRWAEQIYWNLLDCGLRIPPLAGSGDGATSSPVGYNRLYVAAELDAYEAGEPMDVRPLQTESLWWDAAWRGQSVATNGPLLRAKLGGKIPGHVFQAQSGEVLELHPEVALTVRDPVEYLDVIHNGSVHYSAPLDEFARDGGVIPPLMIDQSGWVLVRVVTSFPDHYRVAITAPWYIEFDGRRRVTRTAVEFFQDWLGEYEQRLTGLPASELSRHVPFVRSARRFWAQRREAATVDAALGPGEKEPNVGEKERE